MIDSRIRRCPLHKLRPRCPGCEAESRPNGYFPQLAVPPGTAEYLLNAARFYATQGPISATEFVLAISVDLREASRPETPIPHGTRTGYTGRGCRCDECRAWRSAYYKVKAAS